MHAGEPTRPTSARWSVVAAVAAGTAVVLALVLAVTIGTRLGDDRPRASAGEIILPSGHEPIPADAATVLLPWGPVSVAVGDVTDEVPEALDDRSLVAPPDGGSLVRVSLQPTRKKAGPPPFVSTGKPRQSRAEVVLTADGTEYPIDGPDGLGVSPGSPAPAGGHSRWVAVDGHPSDLSVTVTVAGEEQTVDTDGSVAHGRAEALGDLPTVSELQGKDPVGCSRPKQSGSPEVVVRPSDEPGCDVVGSLRTPFVDGIGWAPEGKEYLVVQASHDDAIDVTSEDDERWATRSRMRARVGGVRPEGGATGVDGQTLGRGTHGSTQQFVFELPADEPVVDLTLGLDVEATPAHARVGERPERRHLEWTIPAEELA